MIEFNCDVDVKNDFKVLIKKKKRGKYRKFFQFWLNTHFIEQDKKNDSTAGKKYKVCLKKNELDKLYKDCKKNKKASKDFQVEASFSYADPRRNSVIVGNF
jgi:site-specific recombinase XerD